MLNVESLLVQYGDRTVLDNASLHVSPGEIVHLRGENGQGKSTLLRIAAGLDLPDGGVVTVDGHQAHSMKARALRSFVPDSPPLYDYLSLRESVAFVTSMWGIDDQPVLDRAREFGLGDAFDTLVTALSLGMRKKLGLVVSTVQLGKLVILDEPFSGLDTGAVAMLVEQFAHWRDANIAVLVTSHDETPLKQLDVTTFDLRNGRITAVE